MTLDYDRCLVGDVRAVLPTLPRLRVIAGYRTRGARCHDAREGGAREAPFWFEERRP